MGLVSDESPPRPGEAAASLAQAIGPLAETSNLPLYQQLQRALREAIDRNILGADDALPPERDLAADFRVSRITVRKAIDGLVSEGRYPGRGIGSYAQLFRTGAVEAVDATPFDDEYNRSVIVAHQLEETTVEALKRYLRLQRELDVSSPVVVMLGLVGVRGYEIPDGGGTSSYIRPVDRDDLIVPEALLEAGPSSGEGEVGLALKRMFDAVWNACGYAESPNFYDDGRWTRHARGW